MATFGWDRGQIYSTSVLPGEDKVNSHAELTAMFQEFIQNFRIDNSFVYRQVLPPTPLGSLSPRHCLLTHTTTSKQ